MFLLSVSSLAQLQAVGIVHEEWNAAIILSDSRQAMITAFAHDDIAEAVSQLPITSSIMQKCRDTMTDRLVTTFFKPVTVILGTQQ